jgi:hypothetical protein
MPDPLETAKAASGAIEEVARTTGKAIDAGRETARWLDGKVGQIIADVIGVTVGDNLSATRQVRQIRLRERVIETAWEAQKRLEARGISEPITPRDKIILPLLEAAAIEDEPELQKLWAELLASALSHEEAIQRRFISVLGDITPTSAKALREYFEETPGAKVPPARELGISYVGETLDGDLYGVSIAQELGRLGLVEPALMQFMIPREPMSLTDPPSADEITVPRDYYRVVLTDFGRAFCEAVGMTAPLPTGLQKLDF